MPVIFEDTKNWYAEHKNMLLHVPYMRYVANGEYEGAVLEGGLKIAETAHIACIFYETEEFMHRSTTQIDRDSVIIITAPQGDGLNGISSWRMGVGVLQQCCSADIEKQ